MTGFYVALWAVVIPGWLACIWFTGRLAFSDAPEVQTAGGKAVGQLLLFLFASFIPWIAAILGWWYIVAGPTRQRSERRIGLHLTNASAADMAQWIDNQITVRHLWSDEWLKRRWIDLNTEGKGELLNGCADAYRDSVRRHVTAYAHSSRTVYADFVAALRDVLKGDHSVPTVDARRYCHKCGVEQKIQDARFCSACGVGLIPA
ncbi:MAG TPA: zinc ribbon domain-containing protein [Burkholderiales bacterium]|nr:zinc ribbon domain-containing protein [Burkholderiales bacterium]